MKTQNMRCSFTPNIIIFNLLYSSNLETYAINTYLYMCVYIYKEYMYISYYVYVFLVENKIYYYACINTIINSLRK